MYTNESIKRYLDDLASRLPAPGGGSSAALAGAMASALIGMVLNFTIGNEKYKEFEGTARRMLNESESLRDKFMKLFDDDIKSYDAVAKAYKMPKATDADKEKRKAAIQEGLKGALMAPLDICQYSVEAIRHCPELAKSANKNLICDVEVPVRMLEAAFYSAKINCVMNQKGIKDETFNTAITYKITALEKDLLKTKQISEMEIAKVTGG